MPERCTVFLFGGKRLALKKLRIQDDVIIWVVPDESLTREMRAMVESHRWDGLVVRHTELAELVQLKIRPITNYYVSETMYFRTDEKVHEWAYGSSHGSSRSIPMTLIDESVTPQPDMVEIIHRFRPLD